jgi:hypothetical protein
MINSELLAMLAAERIADLRRAADRDRVAAAVRPRQPFRLRLGAVTLKIEVERYDAARSASRPT